jgi:hypothetical protein
MGDFFWNYVETLTLSTWRCCAGPLPPFCRLFQRFLSKIKSNLILHTKNGKHKDQ